MGQERTTDPGWTASALYSPSSWPILLCIIRGAGPTNKHIELLKVNCDTFYNTSTLHEYCLQRCFLCTFRKTFRIRLSPLVILGTSFILYFLHGHVAAMRQHCSHRNAPGWRTRYISIYAEAIRQEMLGQTLTLTHVSTDHQLADLLTKPTNFIFHQFDHIPSMGISEFYS